MCDKTDNTVKVIESTNHSPNYVPIKGGFPFRQIAQKWIDENYTTTVCNPGKIVKQIQKEEDSTKQAPNNNLANQPNQPPPAPAPASPIPRPQNTSPAYYNSSLTVNAKFSNLGKAFSSEKSLTPGLNVGFEQLFGQKNYLGVGACLDIYFAEFPLTHDFDKMTLFFGKIPVFVGQRIQKKKYMIMYEVGAEFNTKIIADDESFEISGKTFKSTSFDLMARLRAGTEKVQLTLGTEMWVSKIFEEDDFSMSAFYVGLRFSL